MRSLIAAVNANWVIGKNNKIPWHYAEDLKRFKRLTLNQTVIMGRNTFESMGSKALVQRRNIVITRQNLPAVESFTSVAAALAQADGNIWFIGGAAIYGEALACCDQIDITIVPDIIMGDDLVFFPVIPLQDWHWGKITTNADDPRLRYRLLRRRN